MVPIDLCGQRGARATGCGGRRRARRGFVLLMSLVLILLVGVLLVGLARHSLLLSTESQEAAADLQRRWGVVYLSRALLSDPAARIAAGRGDSPVRPQWLPICAVVRLGGLTFRITLDDENRKLNLNRLRSTGGTPQLLRLVHPFAGAARVELRPLPASPLGVRPFDSWGQVVDFVPADDASQHYDQLQALSRRMTCWGSAKVNLRHCDDEVLRTVGTLAAGPVAGHRLVALRDAAPALARDDLLAQLAVDTRQLALLQGWLSEESDCYSLWLVGADRPASVDFFVRENTGSDSYAVKHFQW